MVKVLLVGYSGHQNFGDDLLLFQAYVQFKDQCNLYIWTNVEKDRSGYLEEWFGEATIIRSSTLGYSAFSQYHKVLYFGGGVFFNYQHYALGKYWKKKVSIIKNYYLSRKSKTSFSGIGIGLGPFITNRSQKVNKLLLSNFDFLNVRDQESYDLAKSYRLQTRLTKDVDLSFNIQNHLNTQITSKGQLQSILICPRKFPHDNQNDNYHLTLIDWLNVKKTEGCKIEVFGFQPNHDEQVLNYYKSAGFKIGLWNPYQMTIEAVFELFSKQSLIISARMHGIYVAGILGIPCIGINVHPKVKDACSLFEKSRYIDPTFTSSELIHAVKHLEEQKDYSDRGNKIRKYSISTQKVYDDAIIWIHS